MWFTVGLLTAPWWLGLFLHALLAFPGGRLEGRWDRWLVGLLYVDVTVVQAVRLLFTASSDLPGCGDCPANVLLVSDRPDVASAILLVQQAVVGSLVIGGTLVVLAGRWRAATAPQRRMLAPVLVTGAVCLVVQAVGPGRRAGLGPAVRRVGRCSRVRCGPGGVPARSAAAAAGPVRRRAARRRPRWDAGG